MSTNNVNFREGLIFAKLADAKLRENKNLSICLLPSRSHDF